jgi:integrase
MEGPSPASTRQPLVGAVLRGIRRMKGVAPGRNQKAPLLTDQIRLLLGTCGKDLQGLRDRALVLTGFAGGGIRRAELAAIDCLQLEFCPVGIVYHQGRSKTDQEGKGRLVAIPFGADPGTCPVQALGDWLKASGITTGPVFRAVRRRQGGQVIDAGGLSSVAVNYIIKRLARRAGLDDERYGAHSLRSGFFTQAAMLGKAGDRAVMDQSGHKSARSLERYERPEFGANAAKSLGL